MNDENILNTINIPYGIIVEKVNWCCKLAKDLSKKYSSKNNNFMRMQNPHIMGEFGNSYDSRKFDGVTNIKKFGDRLRIEGIHKAKSRTVTYDVPVGSMDEGWRIEPGDFTETVSMYAPIYLFDEPESEVLSKMDAEYKLRYEKSKIQELAHWEYQINEAQRMIKSLNEEN